MHKPRVDSIVRIQPKRRPSQADHIQPRHRKAPHFSWPNAIVVQWVEPHGCGKSCVGPRTAHRDVPTEQRWNAGSRARRGPMEGQIFLVSLGDARSRRMPKVTRRKGEKVTRAHPKSELSASVQKSKNQSKADRAPAGHPPCRKPRCGFQPPYKSRTSRRME